MSNIPSTANAHHIVDRIVKVRSSVSMVYRFEYADHSEDHVFLTYIGAMSHAHESKALSYYCVELISG